MMRRWLPVAVLAAGVFATNVVARLVVRLWIDSGSGGEDVVTLVNLAAIGLIFAACAFVRARTAPLPVVTADLGAAALGGLLLCVFVGPPISGTGPFSAGAGAFFAQIWQYGGAVLIGTALGFMLVIALGLDHKAKSLKRYAETARAKPQRSVRR